MQQTPELLDPISESTNAAESQIWSSEENNATTLHFSGQTPGSDYLSLVYIEELTRCRFFSLADEFIYFKS